ncbi:hypothetical protein JKP88DRAFT_283435 [Tribonema minus]|uniref:Uncharacterized protein n=1 Tax=Tribonema minus TaxID=303371 RepID=A0A835YHL9_9STRA|nr:hypothetical protein JKP88DRAFT_283435 [Tribonema minus]
MYPGNRRALLSRAEMVYAAIIAELMRKPERALGRTYSGGEHATTAIALAYGLHDSLQRGAVRRDALRHVRQAVRSEDARAHRVTFELRRRRTAAAPPLHRRA